MSIAGKLDMMRQMPSRDPAKPILEIINVCRTFKISDGLFKPSRLFVAVEDVNLSLRQGEVLGVVGESGCGKTTLSKLVMGILRPTSGEILINGQDADALNRKGRARLMQPVFQDPYSSLNPRRTVHGLIRQPLDVHRVGDIAERNNMVEKILYTVGLPQRTLHAYPKQLSGGQRQRVAIARALILRPAIVICDEPTSALDVSVQAQILNLLVDLRRDFGLTILFVSHNLAVIRHLADNVAVMHKGRVVEYGPRDKVMDSPETDYTKALLKAALL